METGVARLQLDLAKYREQLEGRLGKSREMMRIVFNKARLNPKRIVLAEGEHEKMIRAAHQLAEEHIAFPILLGNEEIILRKAAEMQLNLNGGIKILDHDTAEQRERYIERIYQLRCRKGVTQREARELINDHNYFATLIVEQGDADGMVAGLTSHYSDALRPALQVIKTVPGTTIAAGVYLVATRNRVLFFADATVNIELDAQKLAEIAIRTAMLARDFDIEPRIAMLSFSNFGSVRHPQAEMVRQAVEIIRQRQPELPVDGELQANVALNEELLNDTYPCNNLKKEANVLIFPSMEAANIAYKLVQRLANAEVIGPMLVGMRKPVHIMQRGDEVKDIVNLAAMAVVKAQNLD
jgi:malate dehydrogenase (oxaloacetate-decarboxylating)(NADP+)